MNWRITAHDVVLKALGGLLLVAAVLKGHELLTVPVANKDLWSWRPFLICQVEFELALGMWLLSGVFKRLAWLASVLCFGLFCCMTLYKGLAGEASCGCFGVVKVNPWMTLLTIDLPSVIALSLFHPHLSLASRVSFPRNLSMAGRVGWRSLYCLIGHDELMPSVSRFGITAFLGLVVLGVTASLLVLNKPAMVTSTYEVLEPKTWAGREPSILKHISIAEQLSQGVWLLLFYHHDCPDCRKAIPRYARMADDLAGHEDLLRLALIEVPPYGPDSTGAAMACVRGRLADVKQWFITTPTTVLLAEGRVKTTWEEAVPDFDAVLTQVTRVEHEMRDVRFGSTSRESEGKGGNRAMQICRD